MCVCVVGMSMCVMCELINKNSFIIHCNPIGCIDFAFQKSTVEIKSDEGRKKIWIRVSGIQIKLGQDHTFTRENGREVIRIY